MEEGSWLDKKEKEILTQIHKDFTTGLLWGNFPHTEPKERSEEIKKQVITSIYYNLCRQYVELAKKQPEQKVLRDHPEAIKLYTIMDWLDENYKEFIIKP